MKQCWMWLRRSYMKLEYAAEVYELFVIVAMFVSCVGRMSSLAFNIERSLWLGVRIIRIIETSSNI